MSFNPEVWLIIAIYSFYAYDTIIVTASENIVSLVDIPSSYYFDANAAVSNKYKIWFIRFFRPWILYRLESISGIRPNRKPKNSQIRYLRAIKKQIHILATLGSINATLILIIFPIASYFLPLSYCVIIILPIIYINSIMMIVKIKRMKIWKSFNIERKIGVIADLFITPISSINIAQKIFLVFDLKFRLSDFITYHVDEIGCYSQLQSIRDFLIEDLCMPADSVEILEMTEKLKAEYER